jgi:hypothetical protein
MKNFKNNVKHPFNSNYFIYRVLYVYHHSLQKNNKYVIKIKKYLKIETLHGFEPTGFETF